MASLRSEGDNSLSACVLSLSSDSVTSQSSQFSFRLFLTRFSAASTLM